MRGWQWPCLLIGPRRSFIVKRGEASVADPRNQGLAKAVSDDGWPMKMGDATNCGWAHHD
jgi:hypothetical protein